MTGQKRFDPLSLVAKIAQQEQQLIHSSFIAPYSGAGKVRLRLDGIIYELEVDECPAGWAIMEVTGSGRASYIKRAPMSLVCNYLSIFPRIRLVFVDQFDKHWWAIAAHNGSNKIELNGPVPVFLTENAAPFQTAFCRFDGGTFWFESIDRRRDPKIAHELRQAFAREQRPEELHCKGSLPSEKLAYKMRWLHHHRLSTTKKLDDATRIENALKHAGAELDSFWYTDGKQRASVRFKVGEDTHVVEFHPSDLSIISAGICLSGEDSKFDLSSLIGVLREADEKYQYD